LSFLDLGLLYLFLSRIRFWVSGFFDFDLDLDSSNDSYFKSISSCGSVFTDIILGNDHELNWLSWFHILEKSWAISQRFKSSGVQVVLEMNPGGGQVITSHGKLDDTLLWAKLLEVWSDACKFG
jgi:hypothetical protein